MNQMVLSYNLFLHPKCFAVLISEFLGSCLESFVYLPGHILPVTETLITPTCQIPHLGSLISD